MKLLVHVTNNENFTSDAIFYFYDDVKRIFNKLANKDIGIYTIGQYEELNFYEIDLNNPDKFIDGGNSGLQVTPINIQVEFLWKKGVDENGVTSYVWVTIDHFKIIETKDFKNKDGSLLELYGCKAIIESDADVVISDIPKNVTYTP